MLKARVKQNTTSRNTEKVQKHRMPPTRRSARERGGSPSLPPLKTDPWGKNNVKSVNNNMTNSMYKRHMKTPYQLETLEKAFAVGSYLTKDRQAALSKKVGLSDKQLLVWFSHRRSKEKKENAADGEASPMEEDAQSFTASSSKSTTATSPAETCETDEVSSEDVTNLKSAHGCLKWTTEMDGLMLEVLKEEKNKGFKEDRKTYRNIVTKINSRFGVAIDKVTVVNQLKALKDQMFLACQVLKKKGFGWNEATKRIEAEREVWIAMIKADEKYKLIRWKTLHHLELFQEIFEKDQATGEFAETAKEKVRRWARETELTVDAQGGEEAMKSAISEGISEVANAIEEIARALLSTSQRIWPEKEIVEAMKGLGLEGNDLLDAVDWLVAHPSLIGTFFAYPNDVRVVWLRRRMHGK